MTGIVSGEKCANGMCPVGSMKYGCDCLLYVHRDLDWKEAAAYCAQMTGKLVTVQSKSMQKHIKTFLKAQLGKNCVTRRGSLLGLLVLLSLCLSVCVSVSACPSIRLSVSLLSVCCSAVCLSLSVSLSLSLSLSVRACVRACVRA